jgi:microcompartment protein CcmK/EutM
VTREGGSCRQIMKDELAPINALITGIVDEVHSPA